MQGVVIHGPTVEVFTTGIKIGSNNQGVFPGMIKESRLGLRFSKREGQRSGTALLRMRITLRKRITYSCWVELGL